MDAMVVAREGQWRINKEEEKKNNDERGGGGAVAATISVNFCCCSCVFVRLVAVVAVTAAHLC